MILEALCQDLGRQPNIYVYHSALTHVILITTLRC